jgi:hypothetical protein
VTSRAFFATLALLVVAGFLFTLRLYFHAGAGFTQFIEIAAATHDTEIAALRSAPHVHAPPPNGYDGQYYVEMAVDPLLRDPQIDRTMDLPAYRAHRILLPWIAYAVGLGKPAWIVQVFALENVFVWLAFALLLCRWMPPTTARGFVLWTGCLLSHGMLSSVRYALPDAPSTLLIALAVLAAERDRPLIAAAVIGVASLARETSLLAASVFLRWLLPDRRRWLLVAACLIVCVLPLALWLDYLRSIYRSDALAGTGNLTTPLVGLWWKLRHVRIDIAAGVPWYETVKSVTCLVGLAAQAAIVVRALIRRTTPSAWTLVAASFLVLGLCTHPVVWQGAPGAYTRVLLPLSIGANVLLARQPRASWRAIGLANLSAVAGVLIFAFGY